jgi:hypothetical protein
VTPPHRPSTEEREVRSDDPNLSPEANRLLTQELREAVGSDTVRVPAGTPRRGTDRPQAGSPLAATLVSNRPLIIITLVAAVAVGAAASLATGNWWAVVAMVAVHAVGTLVVATAAIQLTTQTEHASPEVTARLEEEGVADPDRVLSDLMEDYAPTSVPRRTADVVFEGRNERTVHANDDPARAAAEQRTAMTPSSAPGPVAGSESAVAAPQKRMPDAAEEGDEQDRVGPPAHGSFRRLLPIYVAIVVAVVAFTILMGVVVGAL